MGLFTPGPGWAGTDRQVFFINGRPFAPDLFLMDQHATDEKYNFETRQATTRLESQLLFTCVVLLLFCMTLYGNDRDESTGRAC